MTARSVGLVLGPALAIVLQLFEPPAGLSREGWIVASLAILMAVWWATEAIPIAVTALLPLVVFPFAGVMKTSAAGASFGNQIVLLLLGGFFIALALERWNLHERIALTIVARSGERPRTLLLGFMIAAALLSMWISNTATTLMLAPIALSVARAEARDDAHYARVAGALLLGLAYAASVGGVATPVGTPTNLIAIAYVESVGAPTIGFPQWMALGLPTVLVMLPAIWLVLSRQMGPRHAPDAPRAEVGGEGHEGGGGGEAVRARLEALGRITTPELRVALVFGLVALAWILRPTVIGALGVPHLDAINGSQADAAIALTGAIALFLIPAGGAAERHVKLMDWSGAAKLPWNVVLLFGGGLALAAGMGSTGLTAWLGEQLSGVAALPVWMMALVFVVVIVFLTELTSNVATVTAFLPVIGAVAIQAGVDPVLLAAPAAIAGSFAFMLPVATAPNAIVFATGQVAMSRMVRTGFTLNLIGAVVVGLGAHALANLVFG